MSIKDEINAVDTNNRVLFILEKKKLLTDAATWRNLENIMLSETHQSQNDKYCVAPLP